MIASARPLALLLTATLALASAGCGSSDPKPSGAGGGGDTAMNDAAGSNGDNILAESDIASVLDAKRQIDAACGSDGSATADRSFTQIAAAVSTLVTVTDQYPDRVYETGNEDRATKMSRVSQRVTEQLRRCGVTDQANRLARVAKS